MNENLLVTINRNELSEIISEAVYRALKPQAKNETSAKLIRGLRGLAATIPCSISTAQALKNSGKIRFSQTGRLIFFDPEKLREDLLKLKNDER